MKKLFPSLFVLAAFALSTIAASAQTDSAGADPSGMSSLRAGRGKRDPAKAMAAKARYDSLKTSLNLSPAQSTGMDSINLEFRTGMAQLKAEGGDKRSQFRQAKKLKESRDSGLKSVLNPDQFDKLQQYETQVKGERRAMRNGGQRVFQKVCQFEVY